MKSDNFRYLKRMDPADFNDPSNLVGEEVEEMDVEEETVLAVPAVVAELVEPSRPSWQGSLRGWPC